MSSAEPILGPRPDRQMRRKAETRARLLAAARVLFVRNGYHATRPQDIARTADVAVGTFYSYFADKQAAFLAFTREAGDELMERMASAERPGDDFEASLTHALEAILNYSDENPGVLVSAFGESVITSDGHEPGESLRDRLAATLASGLAAGTQSGTLHGDYDTDLISQAVVGLIHQALVHAGDLPRAEVIANVTRFCRRALVVNDIEHEASNHS
jgi:AcrR family transcriptional regulator